MKYIFMILFAIYCLAAGGVFVRISETGPVITGAYRSLLALPFLFMVLKFEKGNIIPALKINMVDFFKCQFAAIFLSLDLYCWNISFMYTTLAESNLLANLVPFIIAPISYFFLKEKISPKIFFPGIIALIGLYILILYGKGLSARHLYGDMLALLTALFYALFLMTNKSLRNKYSTCAIMIYISTSCFFILFIAGFLKHEVLFPTSFVGVDILLALAITSQLGGQTLLAYSIKYIPLKLSTLFILLQPVIATFYAFFIFNETLSLHQIIGSILIILSIFYSKKIMERS